MKTECLDRLGSPKMQYYRDAYKGSTRWNGAESLAGKTIIVYCEQGMGDVIQFVRYIPFLKKRLPEKIILHCPTELLSLLQHIEGVDQILDRDNPELPEHDFHTLSMSLPFLLNHPNTTFPYINFVPDLDSLELTEQQKAGFKIGIAWEGNPEHSNNDTRSCPLRHFKTIHDLPGVFLFMLQNAIHVPELVSDCEDMKLFGAELNDFLDTATLISAMDMVICVDTSVLHLAGALNKPTFGLLSEVGDYRWKVSNWYDSVTLLRQKRAGNWKSVLSDEKLISYIKSHLKS